MFQAKGAASGWHSKGTGKSPGHGWDTVNEKQYDRTRGVRGCSTRRPSKGYGFLL